MNTCPTLYGRNNCWEITDRCEALDPANKLTSDNTFMNKGLKIVVQVEPENLLVVAVGKDCGTLTDNAVINSCNEVFCDPIAQPHIGTDAVEILRLRPG